MFISFFVGKIKAIDLICPVSMTDLSFDHVTHDISFSEEEVKKCPIGYQI
jgi:hypothetical protein